MLNHAINTGNALKYFVMFFVVTTATKIIPTCGVLQEHAIYVGLIAASTFALIDMCSPHITVQDADHKDHF
tara:strand:+ start:402 stop:614 length:213 start_codon:yes stop_codon:yes gene_type:complete